MAINKLHALKKNIYANFTKEGPTLTELPLGIIKISPGLLVRFRFVVFNVRTVINKPYSWADFKAINHP